MTDAVFSIQDETGTVYQLALAPSPSIVISVGDTGTYTGIPDKGTDGWNVPSENMSDYQVTQVLSPTAISIRTLTQSAANWGRAGTLEWATGVNVGQQTDVIRIDAANAYISISDYQRYHLSRGVDIGTPADLVLQGAIVQASDYIDQKYRFKGIKLVQFTGSNPNNLNAIFLAPWAASPYTSIGMATLTPSTSPQQTQWPRQGVVDFSGNDVNGVPNAIKAACAELAIRVIGGAKLFPDYDPTIVMAGGVVSSITERVGPIERSKTFDTTRGTGFFASYPQVDRIVSKAGLLIPGGRTIVR